jgi:cytochrome c553
MMRNGIRKILPAVALLWATGAMSQDDLPIPADELVYCTVCHGVQLMGNPIIRAPRLSGMDSWYVEQQLRNFSAGVRGLHEDDTIGVDMQPMAAVLTDEQIKEAAVFVNATRSTYPEITISGDALKGKAHYSTCAACHGVAGKGNEALGSPDLTIPDDWYLVTQLQNFKSGARGSHPADSYGMQMRASVQLLPDDEAIMDVVSYISTLRND